LRPSQKARPIDRAVANCEALLAKRWPFDGTCPTQVEPIFRDAFKRHRWQLMPRSLPTGRDATTEGMGEALQYFRRRPMWLSVFPR
jgi:hypothetical protein